MKKRITIEDVAQASHVSVATVSLVMRGRSGINIETRKRVEQVARALGYQRRRSHHENHVQRINVLMPQHMMHSLDHGTIESHILYGIEDVCSRRGIRNDVRHIIFGELDQANKPILFPPQYEYGGVIGVGIAEDDDIVQYVRDANIPCVLVAVDAPSLYFDVVHVNYEQAVADLIGYLVSIGHRSVALIDSSGASPWQERMKQAIHRFGMLDPYICTSDATSNSIQEILQTMFQYNPHVSAIIGGNDAITKGVVQHLQGMGRYVPQHISVVGFHDVIATPDSVGVTAIRVDAAALGVLAVQMLLHRIEWPNTPRMVTTVEASLVIRQSTQLYTVR
ncbi:MAG: LacI family DNA-binding transcriptional regulator [Roseiflexaceae bacterium]